MTKFHTDIIYLLILEEENTREIYGRYPTRHEVEMQKDNLINRGEKRNILIKAKLINIWENLLDPNEAEEKLDNEWEEDHWEEPEDIQHPLDAKDYGWK